MKNTITVKPVLVKSKGRTNLWTYKGRTLRYNEANFNDEDDTEHYQLVLVSADSKEKINVGDNAISDSGYLIKVHSIVGNELSFIPLTHDVYCNTETYHKIKDYTKVIATQEQISEAYIEQFVIEYNKGTVKDIEIELEEAPKTFEVSSGFRGYRCNICSKWSYDKEDIEKQCHCTSIKLTDGFVTIVNEEFPQCLQQLLDDKAESNNRIDLDAYANGVLDCYNMLNDKYYSDNVLRGKYKINHFDCSKTYTEENLYALFEECHNLIGYIDTPIGRRKYPTEVITSVKNLKTLLEQNKKK